MNTLKLYKIVSKTRNSNNRLLIVNEYVKTIKKIVSKTRNSNNRLLIANEYVKTIEQNRTEHKLY